MDNETWQLLLVEDDEDDYFIVRKMLAEAHPGQVMLRWATNNADGLQALQAGPCDAILVDYDLGAETGDQFIREAIATGCECPILVLTGRGNYDIDMKSMHSGAADYLNKAELNANFLERSIRYAIERKRTEFALARSNAALHMAERRVRDILNGITDCYFLLDRGWCFLDINENALKYLEKQGEELQGQNIWDVFPLPRDQEAHEKFQGVIAAGQPAHFEMKFFSVSRWADVHAYPVEEGIAVYYSDITKRKQSEQNTRFLADLGETLINLDDPDRMIYSSLDAVGRYLDVERCFLEEVSQDEQTTFLIAAYDTGIPGIDGLHDKADFLHALFSLRQDSRAWIVRDTAADTRAAAFFESLFQPLEIGAYFSVPRVLDGQWAGALTVTSRSSRQWQDDEIILLRQASDLVWLAVGNARLLQNLKITQARFDTALKNSEISVYTTDQSLRYTWLYRPMPPYLTPEVIGKRDDELPEAVHLLELVQLKQQVLDSRSAIHKEIQLCIDETFYLDLTIEPYEGPEGEVIGTIVSCVNTTRYHQMEEQIQTSIAQVALQRRIMESREEERKQISRDLHDGPIQNTIGLLFKVQSALDTAREVEQLQILKEIQTEGQKLVGELRELCNQLRPPLLAQLGLGKAIRSYLEEFQGKHPELTLRVDLCDDRLVVPEAARLALYRVLQEGLNNVLRHSYATEISVSLKLVDQSAVLTILDNGEGIKTPVDWRVLPSQGHLGLVGMKERVEALNGRLDILSDGKGTQIRAVVPYLGVE
jgi:PAS domain S-box-containing protein